MLLSDIVLLQCPECSADLQLRAVRLDNNIVIEGTISCCGCGSIFPVLDGVCIFLSPIEMDALLSPVQRQAVAALMEGGHDSLSNISNDKQLNVGVNWQYQFASAFRVLIKELENEDGFYGRKTFFKFSGLRREDVETKDVAVFCGGSGREAWHLVQANARKVIVLDIGGHINNLNHLLDDAKEKLLLIQCNVSSNPLRDSRMDVAICDHALQHISNHRQAFRKMAACLKPGGKFSICVYSFENNWPMTHIVEPAKILLHCFPVGFIQAVATIPAILLFFVSKIYDCLGSRTAAKMPFFELLSLWRGGGYRKFWEACFDLLHAPISYHFRKTEVSSLADENRMAIISLNLVNDTMWSMVSRKS